MFYECASFLKVAFWSINSCLVIFLVHISLKLKWLKNIGLINVNEIQILCINCWNLLPHGYVDACRIKCTYKIRAHIIYTYFIDNVTFGVYQIHIFFRFSSFFFHCIFLFITLIHFYAGSSSALLFNATHGSEYYWRLLKTDKTKIICEYTLHSRALSQTPAFPAL